MHGIFVYLPDGKCFLETTETIEVARGTNSRYKQKDKVFVGEKKTVRTVTGCWSNVFQSFRELPEKPEEPEGNKENWKGKRDSEHEKEETRKLCRSGFRMRWEFETRLCLGWILSRHRRARTSILWSVARGHYSCYGNPTYNHSGMITNQVLIRYSSVGIENSSTTSQRQKILSFSHILENWNCVAWKMQGSADSNRENKFFCFCLFSRGI